MVLNGAEVDPASLSDGRLPLVDLRPENEVVVTATMRYSNDGQGLHRSVDAADGNHYVYGHLFLDAAPRVYGCFDQPDLKAPYDVRVTTPVDWVVRRQRRGHRCRWAVDAGDDAAAVDVLRHRLRRSLRARCMPSTTASRWASTPGPRSRTPSSGTPTRCSR